MYPHHSKVHFTHLFCDGDERLYSSSPASSKPSFVYVLSIWLMADPLKPHQGAPVYSTEMWFTNFYSYSFRIGAATSAASAGIPAWLIKVLERWSSDCYELYIKTPQSTISTVPELLVSHGSSYS